MEVAVDSDYRRVVPSGGWVERRRAIQIGADGLLSTIFFKSNEVYPQRFIL